MEKLRVFDHRFNFTHRVTKNEYSDGSVRIQGYFRHYKKWNFDDKIRFDFVIRRGILEKNEIKIMKKGWETYLTLGVADVIYSIFDNYSITGDTFDEILDQIYYWHTNSWENAAQKISILIAMEAYRDNMPLANARPIIVRPMQSNLN